MITSPPEPAHCAGANHSRGRQGVGGFDEEYERMMREARERAGGRGDVLEYLDLKAANDAARTRAVDWLLELFTVAAGELNRAGAGLTLTRTDAHRFRVGNSTMVGPRLVLRRGVRALTIEAGWPRAPRDGIVRGGGLASAALGHFGDARAGDELLLLPDPQTDTRWFVIEKTGLRTELRPEHLRRHMARLLD
ncbi:MAG TPA: hypothetical protein VF297_02315 [Pyrinomonadaceae bacterium]